MVLINYFSLSEFFATMPVFGLSTFTTSVLLIFGFYTIMFVPGLLAFSVSTLPMPGSFTIIPVFGLFFTVAPLYLNSSKSLPYEYRRHQSQKQEPPLLLQQILHHQIKLFSQQTSLP